jgi:enoyl-CoA hydratase/carnithine racemase
MTGVRYEVAGSIATITLDRPESRNRLDAAGMAALADHLEQAAVDEAVRVVILTGTGSTFCAGADLSAAVTGDESGFAGTGPHVLVGVLTAMLSHPKPIIGRIQGHVAGGGNGLVAACDIAIASEEARFAFSEVRVGLAPAVISVVCLHVMAPRDAQELLLTGQRVDAGRALRAGLVTAVAAPDELDATVDGYAQALLACGPQALAHTKELLRRIPALDPEAAFDVASTMSSKLFASDEAREGMTAYLEKRLPEWAPPD